jgi:hypothetical protein
MKKYIFTIVLAAINFTAFAQTINVHFKNGQLVQYSADNVDYIDFSNKTADPTETAGDAVDLGLSVYWASYNVGAKSPEEYGRYFAWGETQQKNKTPYNADNYIYYDKDKQSYIDIGNNICGTDYDAATVNLGKEWRLPTKEEMEELINKCTWKWEKVGDKYGYTVKGKNGNSIFMPAAGYKVGIFDSKVGNTLAYWTGSCYNSSDAYSLNANDSYSIYQNRKWSALTIRPVTTNPKAKRK